MTQCGTMVRLEAWLSERLTPSERRALEVIAAAWSLGALAGWGGWSDGLARYAAERLHPPLPTPAELAAQLGPGDPRPALLAAGLALREERRRAAAEPAPLDPNAADRAAWDRLPGIGPRTAEAIIAHRAREGPFRLPEDLLAVRGIGPATLERMQPYLAWPVVENNSGATMGRLSRAEGTPDLNAVDADFLAGLPGIGPKLASSIMDERRRRRGFRHWQEVLAVKGIGEAKLRILQNATRLADSRSGAATPDPAHEGTR